MPIRTTGLRVRCQPSRFADTGEKARPSRKAPRWTQSIFITSQATFLFFLCPFLLHCFSLELFKAIATWCGRGLSGAFLPAYWPGGYFVQANRLKEAWGQLRRRHPQRSSNTNPLLCSVLLERVLQPQPLGLR